MNPLAYLFKIQVLGPIYKADLVGLVGAQESTYQVIPMQVVDPWNIICIKNNEVLVSKRRLGPDNRDTNAELSCVVDM